MATLTYCYFISFAAPAIENCGREGEGFYPGPPFLYKEDLLINGEPQPDILNGAAHAPGQNCFP